MTSRWQIGAFCSTLLLLLLAGCNRAPDGQQIAYVWVDDAAVRQLFLTDEYGAPPVQLSAGSQLVVDFAPAPDGETIAYTKNNDGNGTTLYTVATNRPYASEIILTCEQYRCERPIWAQDSRRIVYERRGLAGEEPQLWWLDSVTGETVPVFSRDVIGYQAAFSADGSYLSFVNPVAAEGAHTANAVTQLLDESGYAASSDLTVGQEIVVFDFGTGEQLRLPNLMNMAVSWSPATPDQFVMLDMKFFGEKFGVHTMHVDVSDNVVTDISRVLTVEDSAPSWSADGKWIAFGRKGTGVNIGMQLWVMRPDGSDARPLTATNHLHHGTPQWSADQQTLLYQQFDLNRPEGTPAVRLYDIAKNESRPVVGPATQPQWIP